MTIIRLLVLLFLLLVGEVLYFHWGGRLIDFFIPQPFILGSVFVGTLWGRRSGMLAGFFLGLLEELCLVGAQGSLGPTSLVYLWAGFLAGNFFYDRFDFENIVSGIVVSLSALLFSYLLGALGDVLFHQSPSYWWGCDKRLVATLIIQGLFLGPLLFKAFLNIAQKEKRVNL